MTKRLAQILERVKTWPTARQAEVVSVLKVMEKSGRRVYKLSDRERRLIEEGLASPLVSEVEMEKFWKRRSEG